MSLTLAETYTNAFADGLKLDPDSWFEDDTPQEQLDLLDSLVDTRKLIDAMLQSGETLWPHLGWGQEVFKVFREWAHDGQLVKVRLMAQWLLSTLPEAPLDPDSAVTLQQLAEGDFCSPFQGMGSLWPNKPEFYRQRLQLGMVETALDWEADIRAEVNTRLMLQRREAA